MKYTLVNEYHEKAMRLQAVGNVKGTEASEVKVGDHLMWNFGIASEVVEIRKETKCFITIGEKSEETGKVYERRLKKNRLVCILEK